MAEDDIASINKTPVATTARAAVSPSPSSSLGQTTVQGYCNTVARTKNCSFIFFLQLTLRTHDFDLLTSVSSGQKETRNAGRHFVHTVRSIMIYLSFFKQPKSQILPRPLVDEGHRSEKLQSRSSWSSSWSRTQGALVFPHNSCIGGHIQNCNNRVRVCSCAIKTYFSFKIITSSFIN